MQTMSTTENITPEPENGKVDPDRLAQEFARQVIQIDTIIQSVKKRKYLNFDEIEAEMSQVRDMSNQAVIIMQALRKCQPK